MPKTAKIAISLPDEVLAAVEQEREGSGESRSQFFRRAVETLLRLRRQQQVLEQYVSGYERVPETKEETEAARRAATTILAEEPWQ